MIKTLRITSIVAAILAVIFFVLPVVFGVRSDKSMEELLNSPGAIENFNKSAGDKAKASQNQMSPLVQQAEAFALYLDPPKPRVVKPVAGRGSAAPQREPSVTPQFKLKGTSFYKGRPELSLALIDEPGKGLHWVRQSTKVGHLLIEQVKDGVVVVKDDKGSFELIAEQKPETSLLEGESGTLLQRTGVSGRDGPSGRALIPDRPKSALPFPDSGRPGSGITETKNMNPEEDAKMAELIEKLRQIQESFNSDKTGSGPNAKEKAQMMEQIISKFKSSRLTPEDAKKLSSVGKELREAWKDSEQSLPEKDSGK